jgi:hypothetical protein
MKFRESVAEGPVYVCSCYRQLWFKRSVVVVQPARRAAFPPACLTGAPSEDGKEYVCKSCYARLLKGKVPSLAPQKVPDFPTLPHELKNLTDLENHLFARKIPFMQVRALPRGKQLQLSGAVVNVPTDLSQVQSILPRRLESEETVALKLKRRLRYARAFKIENVRPAKILEALRWLLHNSPLWQSAGVTIDPDWLAHVASIGETNPNDAQDNVQFSESCSEEERPFEADVISASLSEEEDDWSEDELSKGPVNGDTSATLLNNIHSAAELQDQVFNVVPGEGNRPLGVISDRNFKELAFPSIYGGQTLPDVGVSKNMLCRFQLHNREGRAASYPTFFFLKLRKVQAEVISRTAWLRLRKTKKDGCSLTASMLLDQASRAHIVKTNIGFTDFKCLRGSLHYHEAAKKDVFAMLRQLGSPIFFITNSMADTRWPELLQALVWQAQNVNMTRDEVMSLPWEERARLVKNDPVTCVRYYRLRIETLLNTIWSCPEIIGKVSDFFLRDEFQHRGAPHSHWLAFVDKAPVYGFDSNEEICAWIDKYVNVSRSKFPEIAHLLDLQSHRHSRTCRKNTGATLAVMFSNVDFIFQLLQWTRRGSCNLFLRQCLKIGKV